MRREVSRVGILVTDLPQQIQYPFQEGLHISPAWSLV